MKTIIFTKCGLSLIFCLNLYVLYFSSFINDDHVIKDRNETGSSIMLRKATPKKTNGIASPDSISTNISQVSEEHEHREASSISSTAHSRISATPSDELGESFSTPQTNSTTTNSQEKYKIKTKALVCIITAAYGDDERSVDKPLNVIKYHHDDFKFFFFTNSELELMETPGWEKIIKDTPYRRRITQSRYPKFQAYTIPAIQNNCQTVMYTDASTKLQVEHETILDLAQTVKESKEGLAQRKHPEKRKGISHEFYFVILYDKDIQRNADASMTWLKDQDDFVDSVQLYENKYFCYDPLNKKFQKLADFFWDRYSQELDSWRDQPLWAYTLHHFNATPLIIKESLFGDDWGRMNNLHRGYTEPTINETKKSVIDYLELGNIKK